MTRETIVVFTMGREWAMRLVVGLRQRTTYCAVRTIRRLVLHHQWTRSTR